MNQIPIPERVFFESCCKSIRKSIELLVISFGKESDCLVLNLKGIVGGLEHVMHFRSDRVLEIAAKNRNHLKRFPDTGIGMNDRHDGMVGFAAIFPYNDLS